jgi:hypothetical protein
MSISREEQEKLVIDHYFNPRQDLSIYSRTSSIVFYSYFTDCKKHSPGRDIVALVSVVDNTPCADNYS